MSTVATACPDDLPDPPKRNHRINYGLAATLLAQGEYSLDEVAQRVGAKNANSLKVGLFRRGVTLNAARVLKAVNNGSCSLTLKIASQASAMLRRDAGEILQTHVSKLKEVPAKANLAHIQQVGAALEPLIRSAKIVHDWGNQEATGLVMSGLLTDETPQEAIEVESIPQQVAYEPEKPLDNSSAQLPSDTQVSNGS